ncbi:wax ester/triacylglycerol synthase domain-containing protein, partial [Rhodococcus sp. R1101]|uniref:wax ester/triacylglycerol synthase domain-containing protein n=1 Tax=Rhodococcus sp. R1101 TaxID=1170698 RepID=UPI000369CDBA
MSPTDSMFLLGESRDHPMHVGGLILLSPPDGATAADLGALFTPAAENGEVAPLWRKRAVRSLGTFGQWAWEQDVDFDLEYHVRRNALPQPGGLDELWDLVSPFCTARCSTGADPLWQMHIIEGLADGRLAVYTKIHHALADGVGAMKLLRRALSQDSERTDMPAPWAPSDTPGR